MKLSLTTKIQSETLSFVSHSVTVSISLNFLSASSSVSSHLSYPWRLQDTCGAADLRTMGTAGLEGECHMYQNRIATLRSVNLSLGVRRQNRDTTSSPDPPLWLLKRCDGVMAFKVFPRCPPVNLNPRISYNHMAAVSMCRD